VTETADNHPESELRTRYFRARADDVVNHLEELGRQKPFCLVHVDRLRHEVMLEWKNGLGLMHDVVVTVYELSPLRVAVDIHAAIRSKVMDWGWNRKIVNAVYRHLEQKWTPEERRKMDHA
jgi:hypothetical protein